MNAKHIALPMEVYNLFLAEAQAVHALMDWVGIPATHMGERLSMSQRVETAARALKAAGLKSERTLQ